MAWIYKYIREKQQQPVYSRVAPKLQDDDHKWYWPNNKHYQCIQTFWVDNEPVDVKPYHNG